MPYRANYPRTVREVLDDQMKFAPAALRAVRAFRAAKPWRGTQAERLAKFRAVVSDLAAAYGIPVPQVHAAGPYDPADCYVPSLNAIYLAPHLSVVTLLHEFGHARGFDERQTCRWSINLFRRVFPRSFSRCRQVRHTLVRR